MQGAAAHAAGGLQRPRLGQSQGEGSLVWACAAGQHPGVGLAMACEQLVLGAMKAPGCVTEVPWHVMQALLGVA